MGSIQKPERWRKPMKMAIRTDSCDNAYEKMSVCLSNDIMGAIG